MFLQVFCRPIIVKQMSFISCFCEDLARSPVCVCVRVWRVWQLCRRARVHIWPSTNCLHTPCAATRRSDLFSLRPQHLHASSPQLLLLLLLLRRRSLAPAAPSPRLLRHRLAIRCDSAAPVSHRAEKIICSVRALVRLAPNEELSRRASPQNHCLDLFFQSQTLQTI